MQNYNFERDVKNRSECCSAKEEEKEEEWKYWSTILMLVETGQAL
jgi:hypothetical protein